MSCHVPFAAFHGLSQKKGVRPGHYKKRIKLVNGVSCINLCRSVPLVQSAPSTANSLHVGITEVLADMTETGCKSKGGFHFKGGLCSTL